MTNPNGPIIDMTSGGDFIDPPKRRFGSPRFGNPGLAKPGFGTILARVAGFGVLLVFAALAFWAALFLIPVLLVLGVVGYFVFRQQMKRGNIVVMRRS